MVCIYFFGDYRKTDAHHIPVYPQPAYVPPTELKNEVASGKVIFLPNPSTLRINEVTFGINSIDVIGQLATLNEVCKYVT